MPTRNVSLTKELDQFVSSRVEGGLYANASEVMRTALRLLEKEEREYEEKLAALRAAIDEGLASGVAEEGVFERLDAYIDELAAEETAQQGHGGRLPAYSLARLAESDLKSIVRYTVKTWGKAQTKRILARPSESAFNIWQRTLLLGRSCDSIHPGLRPV